MQPHQTYPPKPFPLKSFTCCQYDMNHSIIWILVRGRWKRVESRPTYFLFTVWLGVLTRVTNHEIFFLSEAQNARMYLQLHYGNGSCRYV